MRHALLLLLSFSLTLLGSSSAVAQSINPLPANLLNQNLRPPSPEAAALGRFGEVPVSLYTGVPSISIPLTTLPGRSLSVPIALQYHGGGVRPDQVAPWTGMNWSLLAGGAIIRTCRGLPDAGGYFAPSVSPAPPSIPLSISTWCTNTDNTDHTNYYDYIQEVLSGTKDSQPDLYSFNFMGYSGQFIFDQQGAVHTIPAQPILIQAVNGGSSWLITTPDGAVYEFSSTEYSNYGTSSAWYLTKVTSAEREQFSFYYQPYQTELTYPNTHTTSALSTQTVMAGPYHCESCPKSLQVEFRPTTHIDGQYLRRIVSATHRVDFTSTGGRLDQPGTRQLNAVRLTCLTDSSRVLEYRLRYSYYASTGLFLEQVQKVGIAANGTETAEPPYRLTYVTPHDAPERGTYAIDRWGYYNGATSNTNPFLHYDTQTYQVMSRANRQTNPALVTFGLLQRLQYPTGGYTDFEFESNDFSNTTQRYATADSSQTVYAQADENGTVSGIRTRTFTLTHAQQVTFHYTAAPTGTNTNPITQLDTGAIIYVASATNPASFTAVAGVNYPTASAPTTLMQTLPAGTYRIVLDLNVWAASAEIDIRYQQRWPLSIRKEPGGGTRIRRLVTYDGLDHARDQTKEYYYDNEQHARSTGKLIHQPVFHSTLSYIIVNGGLNTGDSSPDTNQNSCFMGGGQEWQCNYLIHSAEDMAAASGTAQGSAVGYDTVTVVQRGPGISLRTTSIFHNTAAATVTLDDQATENQGFVPLNFDTQNGLLLQTLDYEVATNGDAFRPVDYRLVRRVAHQYGSPAVPDTDIIGLSIGGSFGNLTVGSNEPCRTIIAQSYRTRVGWWPLTYTEDTRYDKTGQGHTATTRTVYESATHLQPTRQEVTASDGSIRYVRYKYALDYTPGADAGIARLQQQHQVQVPIEQQQWTRPPGQPARWLGGTVTQFQATSSGILVPSQLYQADFVAPQPAPSEPLAPDQRFATLLPSSAYQVRAKKGYTANGALTQQALTHGLPIAYLWDDYDLRPVAEVQNAPADRLACTSFEPGAHGRWTYDGSSAHRVSGGYTGRYAYQLDGANSGQITSATLPAGDYTFAYWAQLPAGASLPGLTVPTGTASAAQAVTTGRDGWKLYRARIHLTGAGTIQLNGPTGRVDELRLHPSEAQMTSYTYEQFTNLTSQADPTGHLRTYEFDALGRLVRACDEQGRILSQQQYHYAQH